MYVTNEHIVHQFMLLFFSVLTILLKISKGNRPLRCTIFFDLVGFVALRPKSTAMVIAGRSVHLTTLFPGQA